jgi:hypothetical protein
LDKVRMLELYKECYYHEFDHKDKINSRVGVPASIIPLLAAADIYLLNHIEDVQWTFWKIWSIIAVTLYSLTLLVSLYHVFRTLYNHRYGYAPTAKEIYDYRMSLENDGYSDIVIQNEMTEFLSIEYAKYAELNRQSNLGKIFYLRVVFYWLIAAVIFGMLCIPAYTIGKTEDADIQETKIMNTVQMEVYNK